MWMLFVRRSQQSSENDIATQSETEVESRETFPFEEQFDSCDGGTISDQNEQDLFEQGFENNLLGCGLDEAGLAF
jgi:hypothetical protein